MPKYFDDNLAKMTPARVAELIEPHLGGTTDDLTPIEAADVSDDADVLFKVWDNVSDANSYMTLAEVKKTFVLSGSASPEGVVTAPVGKYYLNTAVTPAALYIKGSGTGNTGWSRVDRSVGVDSLGLLGATETIDWNSGETDTKSGVLDANCVFTFTAPSTPRMVTLILAQIGGFTVTWPSINWKGPELQPDPTAASTSIFQFWYDGSAYHEANVNNNGYGQARAGGVDGLSTLGASEEINWGGGTSDAKSGVLTENCALTFVNPPSPRLVTLILSNVGGYTVTWPTINWKGSALQPDATAASTSIFVFYFDGVAYHEVSVNN